MPREEQAMTILRTVKRLVPLSLRLLLKERLPKRIVSLGAAPVSNRPSQKRIKRDIECPLCGTIAPPVYDQGGRPTCTGCGSSDRHRHLALATYANLKPSASALALGSDPALPVLCEDLDRVVVASDLSRISPNQKVDLCIHSGYLDESIGRFEDALESVDAVLSFSGKQIFVADASRYKPQAGKQQSGVGDIIVWLKQKGWSDASVFEPDEFYGTGAGDLFGCLPKENVTETIFVIPKRST
jgi:hypothetical protein